MSLPLSSRPRLDEVELLGLRQVPPICLAYLLLAFGRVVLRFMTYGFNFAKIPVSTQWSWFHEFDVENRATGDVGMLTVSLPLSAPGH